MFPLFNNHLDLTKQYFKKLLKMGDIVIDATCGNGHDTYFLSGLILSENSGSLYTLDIQEEALASAQKMIREKVSSPLFDRILFVNRCHSTFPEEIKNETVKLIVYNLGYLPGGDKALTTLFDTTLKSIKNAMQLIEKQGVISITCYPGHSQGEIEEAELVKFVGGLAKNEWNCCHHRFLNREKAPSLLLLQKK